MTVVTDESTIKDDKASVCMRKCIHVHVCVCVGVGVGVQLHNEYVLYQ